MSQFLVPGSQSQATKVAQILRAWANDLEHVVAGLREGADEYSRGDYKLGASKVEGSFHLFRMVLSSAITKRLA